ncbi:MAG: aspartate ammonia-lyase [Candidatus Omnitrophota bacterium]
MTQRKEKDLLGEREIPEGVYWGIHTVRARENFILSGQPVSRALVRAIAAVKKAAAQANQELGFLNDEQGRVIQEACQDIIDGKYADQFPVDALQGGAGTSTNMNVNEVVANLANKRLENVKGGCVPIHPLEHVNLHQSTNDVYPTALKAAAILKLRELSAEIETLQGAFQRKEKAFADTIKVGRTEMQEAVPMTLGAEFGAFAEAVSRDRWRTFKCEERLRVVNIGGTAVGTGLTAPREYIFLVIEKLRALTGLGICRGENVPGETANSDVFVEVSGILKAHAANLIKTAEDLRLLSLLGELRLPAVQAGSSVMPGKVNPVILEAVIQAGFKVMANDSLITESASRATLQINEFLPLLADALLKSLDLLTAANRMYSRHIEGIEACPERCAGYLERSRSIVTAFLPHIGYPGAEELLAEFKKESGVNFKDFLIQRLGQDLVEKVLSPEQLMSLGYRHEKHT